MKSSEETAVLMGMDALRICIGMAPVNFTRAEVLRWIRAMSKS
jgi:hypothetical protein